MRKHDSLEDENGVLLDGVLTEGWRRDIFHNKLGIGGLIWETNSLKDQNEKAWFFGGWK